MNYTSYIASVKERLEAQDFAALPLPGDLAGPFALALERRESYGRLVIALASKLNLVDPEEGARLVAVAGALVRSLADREEKCHLILIFPFDRRVQEEESAALLALRQEGPEQRWSVIPWTADLEVELLDRHSGFPRVDAEVARALTEVPRGAVESVIRRTTGPRIGRPRLLGMAGAGDMPATRLILASTIAYYLWSSFMSSGASLFGGIGGLLSGPNIQDLIRWGANNGWLVLMDGEQWRLFTHIFLHGGIWHLGFNMWALWQLGRYVEMVYGSGRMSFIYLVAGVAGGIASTVFRTDYTYSVGASGAVMGLLGALIYFGWSFKERRVNWQGLWTPVIINLLYGFITPNIDNHAHIGGLVGGMLAALVAGVPGQRRPWRTWAMGATLLLILLLVSGVLPLPHLTTPT